MKNTYCSPRCGRGCTHKEFQQANANGKKLLKLLGKGWNLDVWENLGWHYRAISPCGRIKVHPSKLGYSAYLGENNSLGGKWCSHGRTPKTVVRNVINLAKNSVAKLNKMIDGL